MRLTVGIIAVLGFISLNHSVLAQAKSHYNPNSVRPVRSDDIMWKKSLWFRVDLRRKDNAGFYARGHELTKMLIEAAKNGSIKPYYSDSLRTQMPADEFLKRIRVPQVEEEELNFDEDTEWDKNKDKKNNATALKPGMEYTPRQLYVIELKIDRIFDKRKSRMINDIQSISIILPADQNPAGFDKEIVTFSFKDVYENFFHIKDELGRKMDNPDAIHYNMENPGAHLNLADAFDLTMYHGFLYKYENPKNASIVELFSKNGKRALAESEAAIMKMLEYEATLWSY